MQLKDEPVALLCFAQRRAESQKKGYKRRKSFADLRHAPKRERRALNQLDLFDSAFLKYLKEVMFHTFPGDVALKEKSVRRL